MSKAVLSEIARLEADLVRIQRELQALRLRVDGTGRKTQALAAFKTQPPPPFHAALHGDDVATGATLLPPSVPKPSAGAVSAIIVTDRHASRPDESGRVDSRRNEAGQVGLSAPPPPHSNATPSRRNAAVDPDAGRYVSVGEGRSPRRR